MADLCMAVTFGSASRNSGTPHEVDVVGHLYVGGSGVWQLHYLNRRGRTANSLPNPVRIRSIGHPVEEIVAGFVLTANIGEARTLAANLLGPTWNDDDIEASVTKLRRFTQFARKLNVACVITDLGASAVPLVDPLVGLGWSVMTTAVVHQRLVTQWG
jgi:hypothetical protein